MSVHQLLIVTGGVGCNGGRHCGTALPVNHHHQHGNVDATAWCTPACMCSLMRPTTKSTHKGLDIWKKGGRNSVKD